MKKDFYTDLFVEKPDEIIELRVSSEKLSFFKRIKKFISFRLWRMRMRSSFEITDYEYWAMSFFSYSSIGIQAKFKDEYLDQRWEPVYYCDQSDGLQFYIFKSKVCEHYVISFRGTDGVRDWASNILLMTDFSFQYRSAKREIANFFRELTHEFSVSLCGHSLGGALAQKNLSFLFRSFAYP